MGASSEFSDLFLADGSVINLGNDQDVKITHDPDDGLELKSTATADNNPFVLTIQTGETAVEYTDVLGAINFQAPDESDGSDAVLVAGGIEMVAASDFTAVGNYSKMVFKTAQSETATEKMSLDSYGTINVSGDEYAMGNDLNFGNYESISNSTNGRLDLYATTTRVSGDLTVAGNDLIFGNIESIDNSTNGQLDLNAATVAVGTGSATGVVKSNGNHNLTLKTGNSTTGSIKITDGSNGDIIIAPNGTGKTDFDDNPITGYGATVQTLSGTSLTLDNDDNGTIINVTTTSSAITITVPSGLATGFNCMIIQTGDETVTLTNSSTTLRNRNGLKTAGQYAIMTLVHIGSNVYVVSGDTKTS